MDKNHWKIISLKKNMNLLSGGETGDLEEVLCVE